MKNDLFSFQHSPLQSFNCENPNINNLLKQKSYKSSSTKADKSKKPTEQTLKSILNTISCFRELNKANTALNQESNEISKEFYKLKKLLKKHYFRGK